MTLDLDKIRARFPLRPRTHGGWDCVGDHVECTIHALCDEVERLRLDSRIANETAARAIKAREWAEHHRLRPPLDVDGVDADAFDEGMDFACCSLLAILDGREP